MNYYEDYDYDYHSMANDAYYIEYQEDDINEPWDIDDMDYDTNDIKEYENYYDDIIDDIED